MKTVITELFEKYRHLLPDIEEEYKEKEKQQIIDANNAGWRTHRRKENQNALDYYNETFKND